MTADEKKMDGRKEGDREYQDGRRKKRYGPA
jgi:hypothetical protein